MNIWVDDWSYVNVGEHGEPISHGEPITHFELLQLSDEKLEERANEETRKKISLPKEWIYENETPKKTMLTMNKEELTATAKTLGEQFDQSNEVVLELMNKHRQFEEEVRLNRKALKDKHAAAKHAISKAMSTLQNHIFKKKVCTLSNC
jgi:hypothetical protein